MDRKKAAVILPCKDEENTIGKVIDRIRNSAKDIDFFIIGVDDNSKDASRKIMEDKVDKLISLDEHLPLAQVIRIGMDQALMQDPDLIIHIDADGQYNPMEIPRLIRPILKKKADLVIGDRAFLTLGHMSLMKKVGNMLFSLLVSALIRKKVNDSQSGFRALNIGLARSITLKARHTYTQEQIIRASRKGFKVTEVKITFRKREFGRSRLITSMIRYAILAAFDIIRASLDGNK